jgi:replicative DNA helicase
MSTENPLSQNLPPHDLEAEESLLGSLLLNSKLMDDIVDKLRPEYFYQPKHQVVYHVCLDLWGENQPIDLLFVLNKIQAGSYTRNLAETEVIDKDFLLALISKSSLSNDPSKTADLIRDKFLLRTIINTSDEMKTLAVQTDESPEKVLDQAQEKLYEISLSSLDKSFVAISDILGDTFERISELYHNQVEHRGVPTGFTDIDKILGGLHNSDMVILAARPSMGKTSLAMEMAKRVAMWQQTGVAVFSLEMSKDQLVDRMLSSVSGIDAWKIKTGKFSNDPDNDEFAKLGTAIGELDQAPIWIDDSGSLNVLELRSKARRLKSRHNIGLILIDYLQLMSTHHNKYAGNRVQEVSDISRGLKMLARELNLPIIALSQLSRSVEGRDDKRPMLSDLRESGSIEQDADVVMFVHREEQYHKETKKKGIADILISKHRNGQTGMVELAWLDRLATFENLEGAKKSYRTNE